MIGQVQFPVAQEMGTSSMVSDIIPLYIEASVSMSAEYSSLTKGQ
jgi:hypothetical protein